MLLLLLFFFKLLFRLPYKGYTGGVLGIRPAVFEKVNGFSNLYFGWGREDDDFRERYVSLLW